MHHRRPVQRRRRDSEDCALIEFPSATAPFADDDNDGLYLTGGAHSLTDCLIGWSLDDGIDAGSGVRGSVTVHRCWFESSYHEALAWSETRICTATDSVALNCGQGIECGFGAPDVNAVHCLSTANAVGARFGDNYDWTYNGFLKVRDSLLLFNHRDIWGRAWDNWTVHLTQMDLRDNYVTIPDSNFPNNRLWNPQADPNQLDELRPFLPTPADSGRGRHCDVHGHARSHRNCEGNPRPPEHLHDQRSPRRLHDQCGGRTACQRHAAFHPGRDGQIHTL